MSTYNGSQAFNQMFLVNEYVNKNSGSLTLTMPIVNLNGINQHIGLKISVVYSADASGNGLLGLPQNWNWNISYVLAGTVTAQGKTSIIDPKWTDSSGYQSGIRYLNDHGVKFQQIIPPQPLPGRPTAYYGFKYCYADGAIEYFDATGKILQHADIFGNAINYYYTPQLGTVQTCRLDKIVDSLGQTTTFTYGPNAIYVTTPDGAQTTILYSAAGISQIIDPLGNKTIATYTTQSGDSVINTIRYPTGLQTSILYTALNYLDATGATRSFPAVSELAHISETGAFMDNTRYAYGIATAGSTYTGYKAGYKLGSANDGLMESNNTSYRYDVLITKLDASGNLLSASCVFYNYLHVPVSTSDQLIGSLNTIKNAYLDEYTYLVQPNIHARMVNFNRPIITIRSVWNGSQYVPLKKSTVSYDNYGQSITSEEWLYDANAQKFILQVSEQNTYVVAAWGGEMPLSTISTDEVEGFQKKIDYTLNASQTAVASGVLTYRANSGSNWSPWKTKSYTYDGIGRMTSLTLAWSNGVTPFPGSVQSTTETYTYAYDSTAHELVVSITDPNGNVTLNTYNMMLPGGPECRLKSPLGSISQFSYDALGRKISHTDPNGNVTTTTYAAYGVSGINSVTTLMPDGYIGQIILDALGREIQVADNGDPTTAISPSPNRILRTMTHNAMGLLSVETDALGLSNTYLYDGLGRVIQHTDGLQNITATTHDDANLLTIMSVNGVLQQQTYKDGIGRTVQVNVYPDQASGLTYYHQTMIEYNGLGKKTGTQLNQVAISGNKFIQELNAFSFTYDPDLKIDTHEFNGFLGSEEVTVNRQLFYELQNHEVQYIKTVGYSGGKTYTHPGAINKFNAAGQLISYTNQMGQEESYMYNADGRIAQMTRFDGTAITHKYDANGNLTNVHWLSNSKDYTYNNENKITAIKEAGNTTAYSYYLDGSLKQVTFPDGCSQVYTLDKYSRIVSQQDASGNILTNGYNAFSQIYKRSYLGDDLTLNFGVVNGIKGTLTSVVMSGGDAYTRNLQYDGFGQLIGRTIDNGPANILSETLTRDPLGRITQLQLSSTRTNVPALNLTKTFAYDGLNQLVSEQVQYKGGGVDAFSFTYDGNSNVLVENHNATPRSFNYNAIDQLQAPGITYDANGRMITDSMGNSYTYNIFDHLLTVTSNMSEVLNNFSYYPDGALSNLSNTDNAQNFYYDSGAINAIQVNSTHEGPQDTAQNGKLIAPGWTTFLISQEQRESAYVGSKGTYLHTSNRSTALFATGANDISFKYEPYGLAKGSGAIPPNLSFSWNQEYQDTKTNLVYLRSRFYDPASMRFLTMDGSKKDNRYSFGNADPVNAYDPTGHSAVMDVGAALAVSAVVGIIVTVATGGVAGAAAAEVFGTECVAASIAVGALAGATGSIAGDATFAGLRGEKFTAERAMIDLAAGAAGGGAGAAVGGAAGSLAMRIGLAKGLSQAAITRIGAIASGVSGGIAGSLAAAGVTSGAYHEPFFSESTAISLAVGAAGGLGGGLLTSRAYEGFSSKKPIPVPVRESEFSKIYPDMDSHGGRNWMYFVKDSEHAADAGTHNGHALAMGANGNIRDTIDIHGYRRGYLIRTLHNGQETYRPISQKNFGKYIEHVSGLIGGSGNPNPIKLLSCKGAYSNAQALANAVQRPVFAGYQSMTISSRITWHQFMPR